MQLKELTRGRFPPVGHERTPAELLLLGSSLTRTFTEDEVDSGRVFGLHVCITHVPTFLSHDRDQVRLHYCL